MRRVISRFAVLAAAILSVGVSFAEEEVLFWMVDDSASIEKGDGTTVNLNTFLVPADDYAARIRVVGEGITEPIFLDFYYPDGTTESGANGVDFNDPNTGSGYWGAGVPDGIQSPLGAYASPEYSFIVEIGNFESGDWVTLAASGATSYALLSTYISERFDISPPSGQAWAPMTFTEVPEPSGGLLLLVGGALLTLRRRNRRA